jgi:hypothetical protein
MSNAQLNPQQAVPSFWKRLSLAVEAAGESYEEQLEKRVRWLEGEVNRLSVIPKNPSKR